MVIGPKGSMIKEIIEASGVTNIVVDGDAAMVTVAGTDDDSIQVALDRIEAIAGVSEMGPPAAPKPPPPPINEGDTFEGAEIRSVVPFGIFVELFDGVDGFCHISELSEEFIRSMDEIALSAGDSIDVVVTQFNEERRQYRVKPTAEVRAAERHRSPRIRTLVPPHSIPFRAPMCSASSPSPTPAHELPRALRAGAAQVAGGDRGARRGRWRRRRPWPWWRTRRRTGTRRWASLSRERDCLAPRS